MTLRAFSAVITVLLLAGVIFSAEVAQTPLNAQDYATPTPNGLLPFPTALDAPGSRRAPRTLVPGVPVETTPELLPLPTEGITTGVPFLSTTTPTPSSAEFSGSGGLIGPASAPVEFDYEEVIATNVTEIRQAIALAHNPEKPNLHIIIVLSPRSNNDYIATDFITTDDWGNSVYPVITGHVTIRGNGAVLRRGGQTTAQARILTVGQGGFLRIEELTVQGGSASATGGGGILNHEGTLEVYRSTIQNNQVNFSTTNQILGGGIYSFFGNLSVVESRILNNRALTTLSDGGGVGIIGTANTQAQIIGSEISGNRANRFGNGLFVAEQNGDFTNNCFFGNYNPNPTSLTSNISVQIGAVTTSIFRNSWWGSPSGPITTGPATSTQDSKNAGSHHPVLTSKPVPCDRLPIVTPTPTPTPPDPIGAIIQDLNLYGVTVYASGVGPNRINGLPWSLEELQEVQEAVHDTARAFNLHLYNNNSGVNLQARELFRNVMKQVQSGANFEILRVNNDFLFGNGDQCDGSQDEGCTSNGNVAIALYGNFPLNGDVSNAKYTIVHELGHRFENQSSTNDVFGIRQRMDGFNVIEDCQGDRVMGKNIEDLDSEYDWKRGLRGWGTQGRSLFQQNPLEIIALNPTDDQFLELTEAAADMFLNWVYRRLSDPVNDVEDYCTSRVEIGEWLGFRNINGNGQFDTSLPGNSRFAWMQIQIEQIFTSQTGWR